MLHTLWRDERWHCVYEPFTDASGRLVAYSGDHAVLQMPDVSQADAHARANVLRVLTRLATARLNRTACAQ